MRGHDQHPAPCRGRRACPGKRVLDRHAVRGPGPEQVGCAYVRLGVRFARGDLVASLAAWLSRHGQWDAAAADLGVHRHTLRYRMRRVEEILGRSLDDPDVRMELWLALKASPR